MFSAGELAELSRRAADADGIDFAAQKFIDACEALFGFRLFISSKSHEWKGLIRKALLWVQQLPELDVIVPPVRRCRRANGDE